MWQLQNLPQLNAANKFLSYVLEDLSHEVAFLSGNMLLFLYRGLSSILYEPGVYDGVTCCTAAHPSCHPTST